MNHNLCDSRQLISDYSPKCAYAYNACEANTRRSVALDYNWRLLFTAYEVIFKKHWESKSLLNIVTHYPIVKKSPIWSSPDNSLVDFSTSLQWLLIGVSSVIKDFVTNKGHLGIKIKEPDLRQGIKLGQSPQSNRRYVQ